MLLLGRRRLRSCGVVVRVAGHRGLWNERGGQRRRLLLFLPFQGAQQRSVISRQPRFSRRRNAARRRLRKRKRRSNRRRRRRRRRRRDELHSFGIQISARNFLLHLFLICHFKLASHGLAFRAKNALSAQGRTNKPSSKNNIVFQRFLYPAAMLLSSK